MLRWATSHQGLWVAAYLKIKRPPLYAVVSLGERKFFLPARCDDTTGTHPNQFRLGFGRGPEGGWRVAGAPEGRVGI